MNEQRDLVTPGVASNVSGVQRKTLRRWAETGLIWSLTTAGGHCRYDRAEMASLRELMDGMTTNDVAAVFHVDPKTVSRWAAGGQLTAKRTPGGGFRFRREDVAQALKEVIAR